jgi:hypothetical protein
MTYLRTYLQRQPSHIYRDTHRKNFKLITMGVLVFYLYFKMGVFSFVDTVRVNLALYCPR